MSVAEEIRRVVSVIEAVARKIAIPISVDTTKAEVAHAALQSGAEIINDISGLRFDSRLADEAAQARAGLILMHSRGTPETMHKLEPVAEVLADVITSLHQSIAEAERRGVGRESIVLDPGIGFSKSAEQNVELLAKLNKLVSEFAEFPILVGTSRKRFIGALLGDVPADERIHGTMATVTAAVLHGASIVRVHDVHAAVQTVRVADAIKAVTSDK